MSWPNTVSLITGTVGDSLGSSGESADRIYVAVTPVFGEGVHRLLHAASGTVWDDRAVVTSGTPGLFVQVPHVDQPGFVDGVGNEVTDWYYLVQVITRAGTGKSQWSYYWQPRVADGDTVDLDTLGDGVLVTDPVLVYTPGRDAADAREAAAQALASALEAEGLVTTAAGYVEAAAGSAQAAHLSEQNAATSVTDALAAVADAESSANAAEDSAVLAGGYADTAAGSTGDTTMAARISDPSSSTRAALAAGFAGRWQPNTAYAAGAVIQAPDGTFVAAKAAFTSGSSYSSANWTAAFAPFRPVAFQVDAQVNDMYMLGSYSAVNIVGNAASAFSADIAGWTVVSGCTISWDSTVGHTALGALKITHDGNEGTSSIVRSPILGVIEGIQYVNEFFSKPGATPGSSQRNCYVTIEWRSGNTGSGAEILSTVAPKMTPERNGTWQKPNALGLAVTGATYMSVTIEYIQNHAGEVHWIDDFVIRLAADRVYARNSANGQQLYYNETANFPALDGWRPLPPLPAPITVYKVAQALNGDVVAFANQSGTNALYHLTLGATSWTSVQAIQANVNALYRSMAVDPTGRIFFAEYATSGLGVTTFHVWSSTDNGNTWAKVETFTNFLGHIHAIKIDPYVPGRVWLCMGDSDSVANVRYTDNIDAGVGSVPWTVVDSGAQHARAVDLVFTEDYVAWAGDTPDTTQQKMYRYNRTTGLIDVISDDQELTGFYGLIDSAGRWMWATAARTDNDGYPQVRLWAGRIGSYGRQAVMSMKPVQGAVRLDCYIDGPDSLGNIYISYANQGVKLDTSLMMRGHLMDANPPEVRPLQMVDRQRVAQASYIKVGPYSGTDDAVTTVAGRMWMQSFTPDVDMPATGCWLHIGSALGISNTIQVLLLQPDYNDFWKTILCMSTADAPGLINTDQKFTFDAKPLLQRGKRYALGVAASVAGGKLRGGTSGIKNSNHTRVIASGLVLPLTYASTIADTKASVDVSITALLTSN